MERARDGSGYGTGGSGACAGSQLSAAEKGALAVLIRSIGTPPRPIDLPIPGACASIPGSGVCRHAAISNPDADQLERLMELGDAGRRGHGRSTSQINENLYQPQCDWRNHLVPSTRRRSSPWEPTWIPGTWALARWMTGPGVGIIVEAARRIMASGPTSGSLHPGDPVCRRKKPVCGAGVPGPRHAQTRSGNYQLAAESDFGAGRIYALSAKVSDPAWPSWIDSHSC